MGDLFGGLLEVATFGLYDHESTAEQAAKASSQAAGTAAYGQIEAARIQADYMREALDYLKEVEELPQQFREESLQRLAGISGLPGGTGSQQEIIDRALASPLYGALMSGKEAGEEAILRNAAATGGLRSGNVQEALYDYNTQLQNQALLNAYNQQLQGLQSMAGLSSNASEIANLTSNIGQALGTGQANSAATQAQGLIAAAQAQQTGQQQFTSNVLGLSGILAGAMFSDRRLKKNIKLIGNVNGWNWYSWTWNSVAEKMGLRGESQGCMADEVYAERPDAVFMRDLFMMIQYPKIGVFCNG